MELVAVMRILWRHRVAVVLGAVVAVGLGAMALPKSSSTIGTGSLRVYLDTPLSQTVDAHSPSLWTLTWQAALLGDLMGEDGLRRRVADEVGVPADRLVIAAPKMAVAPRPMPLPEHALDVAG